MMTKVHYMYRDASNYKFHGCFVVSGKLSLNALEPYLFDGEFFVPHEVGLDHLLDMPMNEDDHYLHTFEEFEDTETGTPICSANQFVDKLKNASERGWVSSFY